MLDDGKGVGLVAGSRFNASQGLSLSEAVRQGQLASQQASGVAVNAGEGLFVVMGQRHASHGLRQSRV